MSLLSVWQHHKDALGDLSLIRKAKGDGACLTNCAAMFIYEDEDMGREVKKMVNDHMINNWTSFYKYKVAFPFSQTVGVGEKSKQVLLNTEDDYLNFLRSDEALSVFSDTQEVLALCNIFNVEIRIFKYGFPGHENRFEWIHMSPDPELQ